MIDTGGVRYRSRLAWRAVEIAAECGVAVWMVAVTVASLAAGVTILAGLVAYEAAGALLIERPRHGQ